jgi:hypothetical protein
MIGVYEIDTTNEKRPNTSHKMKTTLKMTKWMLVTIILVSAESCFRHEEYPCDFGTEKVIYVTDLGTNEVVSGADVFLWKGGSNNSHGLAYHCKTDERGMAHWPCALDYTSLCVTAGDKYWDYCPGHGYQHGVEFLRDDIYELTPKSTIRLHIPIQYTDSVQVYGYLSLICNRIIDYYTAPTEYGHYADLDAYGAKENMLIITRRDPNNVYVSSEYVPLCPPPFDTLEYYIPLVEEL